MKKIICTLLFLALMSPAAHAFLYDDVNFITREEIKLLPNKQLFEIYVNTKVIEKASQEFHVSAGFSNAKEYKLRQKLIRLLFDLRYEMSQRDGVDPASVDENMK